MANIFELFKQIETKNSAQGPVTHIIAALGNPGSEYARTRHNAGFMAADLYASSNGIQITKAKFNALTAETVISGHRVLIMKPQLYMNRSGESVRAAVDFYKIPVENVLVICDDVNLDVGKIRLRRKGSDGGQKGLRDIITQLGSDNFPRIRVGVGKLPQGGDMVNWVLGKIPSELDKEFSTSLLNVIDAIPSVVSGKIEDAMSKYN